MSEDEEKRKKREKSRAMVVNELVQTEKDYIRDLKVMVKHYVAPLREKEILTPHQITGLFSNIELLIPVNEELMRQLTEAENGCVGRPLLNMGHYMKMYSAYCNNQGEAMALMATLLEENEEFKEHCHEAFGKKECRMLDLGSFLVKPMQRVCKYPLLLRELIKNTDEQHADYADLQAAMKIIGDAVTAINEFKREQENSQKLLEIQHLIEPVSKEEPVDILAPSRRLLEQADVLHVTSKFKRIKAHYFLFNDLLVLTRARSGERYKFILKVPINEALVNNVNVAGETWSLEVVHAGSGKVWLCFAEEEMRDEFKRRIGEMVEEHLQAHMAEYAKELERSGQVIPQGLKDADPLKRLSAKPLPRPPSLTGRGGDAPVRGRRMTVGGALPSPSSRPPPPPRINSPLPQRRPTGAASPRAPVVCAAPAPPASASSPIASAATANGGGAFVAPDRPMPSPATSAASSEAEERRRRNTVSASSPSRTVPSPTVSRAADSSPKPPVLSAAKPTVPAAAKPPVPASPKPRHRPRSPSASSPVVSRAAPRSSAAASSLAAASSASALPPSPTPARVTNSIPADAPSTASASAAPTASASAAAHSSLAKTPKSSSKSSSSKASCSSGEEVTVRCITKKKELKIKVKHGCRYNLFRTRVCRASRQFAFKLEFEENGARVRVDDDASLQRLFATPAPYTMWLT